ncbi:hypothetical protein [Mesorhizobium sp. ES1-4]|uniref:hypothetical protein n=1 Tax=Mesorhizobium sp. ES1-4 TaxID=2876627 RepID=UPI001CCD71CE|nr:hypothetical protein [Mesorhizobium sp. ES1-4]MBZ9797107.1 hypothetical protein [Mesorhizobium sp. ES1-4]
MTRRASPTIALFPEASFGAALNCVGIAQALRARDARPVFICHAGFSGVFADCGFQEYQLPSDEPLSDSARQSYWQTFVRRHLPHFRLSPIDQLESYVAPTWQAIVDTAVYAEAPLRHDNAQRAGETGVGDHIGRDAWTEGVLERAILGLLADDAMRARPRDNAAEMALKPGTDVAAQAIPSLIRT